MNAKTPHRLLRLDIDPVIQRRSSWRNRSGGSCPVTADIIRAAQGIAEAAHEAKRVARHAPPVGAAPLAGRLPALALLLFAFGSIGTSSMSQRCTSPCPKKTRCNCSRLAHGGRVRFEKTLTEGSRESLQLLLNNQVDLAFIQGGIRFPTICLAARTPVPNWCCILSVRV